MRADPVPGRYHRLPLPAEGAPLEEQFDAFIRFLRVSQAKARGLRGHVGLGFAPVRGCLCPWLHPIPIAVDPAGEVHVVQLLVPTPGWR